ncbi:hypothetical protein FIBSPDRAFT_945676 [Athelia psychrophila]|uniref:Proteophosphoglycan ppg4 n=1 Tax=Athelia psychrophila TaxID=1759441 RepID=A0A166TLL3_9AGAM|nr:hypothetical protein FIBSPDRAFT_945676 [Fibularhizoctonia sp. CBS 109695]
MINPYHHPPPLRIPKTAHTSHARALAVLLLSLAPTAANASPFQHLEQRADSNSNTESVKIWVPIIVVVVVVVLAGCLFWWRKSLASGFINMGESAAIAAGVGGTRAPGTREVTADQLAGRSGQTTAPATGVATARRQRRNRRTPSQISTHSLPLYNKDPGDQELVIYRGQDPEDESDIPVTVVMPPLDEGVEGGHSRNASRTSIYGQLPDSPQNQSLMQGDESLATNASTIDASTQHLLPPIAAIRGSFDTIEGSEESVSSLFGAVQSAGQDPRGDAPAYFEAVDLNDTIGPNRRRVGLGNAAQTAAAQPPQDATVGSRPSTDTQPDQETRASRRMSGFRGLLNTFTPNSATRPPIPPIPQATAAAAAPGHTRGPSGASMQSSNDTHGRDRAASRASFQSGSGSMMAVFRTISRQKSHTTLASGQFQSPSMISLNSISAPLSHTLTRTEISYPASGPTAEQMRLISSRESFARFAVPYGASAIAFAASASRHDLEPTPDYSEAHPPPPLPVSGLPTTSTSTVSALRLSQSPLAAAPVVEGRHSHSPASSMSSQSLQEAPADDDDAEAVPAPVAEAEAAKEESDDKEKVAPEAFVAPAIAELKIEPAPAPSEDKEVPPAFVAPAAAEPKIEPASAPSEDKEAPAPSPAPAAAVAEPKIEPAPAPSQPTEPTPAFSAPASDTDFAPSPEQPKTHRKYGSLTPSTVPSTYSVVASDTDFAPSSEQPTSPKSHQKYGSLTPSTAPSTGTGPTSFKGYPAAIDMRSESRASSMMSGTSFATAEDTDDVYESAPSGTHTPEEGEAEAEYPPTPMPQAAAFNIRAHERDFTGATITPRAN